jgi:hypothetical protein
MSLRSLLAVGLACGLLAAAASAGRDAGPPPGATALCRDGTYSFSQTHSGSCSHHGGVAQWLDGKSAATPGSVTLGMTVLVSPRTKTSHCRLGANPDRACSPGAYYSGLTTAVLCSATFHTSTIRNVPQSEKFAVETEYGLKPGHYGGSLEIDHIVSLELGGSNDIANLYPERLNAGPGYRVKDRLENKTHSLVCAGGITLHASQVGIATNWQVLYKRVFGKSV